MKEIRGILPPIATPFDADGNVSTEHLAGNLTRLVETGLHGFVVLGSNGEYAMLSKEEKLVVLEAARKVVPSDRLFIAGTGADSTRESIDLTKRAAAIGADYALLVTPHYYRPQMTNAALIAHYRAVADVSPIPIMIYNVPAYSNVDVDPAVIVELSRHENIAGMKDSSANFGKMGDVIRYAPARFAVLAGTGSAIFPSLAIGAKGTVGALANVAPRECIKIYDLFFEGKMEEARNLQLKLIRTNAVVTNRFGVPGLKAAMEEVGYYGGKPRSPIQPLGENDRNTVREILREAELI